jgi:hypothetical protein
LKDAASQRIENGRKVRVDSTVTESNIHVPSDAHQPEHTGTRQNIEDKEIHANHVEALNSSIGQRLSCYRRKTNRYAKDILPLQRRLDAKMVLHNFVWPHFTLKEVPAVALGILEKGLSWFKLL